MVIMLPRWGSEDYPVCTVPVTSYAAVVSRILRSGIILNGTNYYPSLHTRWAL